MDKASLPLARPTATRKIYARILRQATDLCIYLAFFNHVTITASAKWTKMLAQNQGMALVEGTDEAGSTKTPRPAMVWRILGRLETACAMTCEMAFFFSASPASHRVFPCAASVGNCKQEMLAIGHSLFTPAGMFPLGTILQACVFGPLPTSLRYLLTPVP